VPRAADDVVGETSGPVAAGTLTSAEEGASSDAAVTGRRLVVGPLTVAGLALTAYVTFSWSQWRRLETPSWDLGIFTQLAQRYAHLQSPVVDIKGAGFNLLGDHFHPLLVLLGLPYRIAPSAFTVMVVQSLLFAWSVWVVGREAVRRLGPLVGSLVGASYAVSFGIAGAVEVQFHEIAFAVPLLALSLVALLHRRWWPAALWAAPLVFVKEDLGATVLVIGLLLAWRADGDHRGRWVGRGLAAWGGVWLVLTQAVILPALNPDGVFAYADRLDWRDLATHPWLLVTHLVDDQRKVITLLLLVAVTGLVGLRSPVMLVAVPTILWRFWSGNYGFWGHTWHYSAVLMPIAFVALLEGVELAGRSPRAWLARYSRSAVAVAVTVAVLVAPQVAFGRFGNPAFWRPNPRAEAARGALAAVPGGASVETDVGLMNYLVDHHDVFWMGNAGNPAADYLVFDSAWAGVPRTPAQLVQWATDHHPGAVYAVTYDEGGYLVARRTS
jgi:uncharacterized membrane protein